MGTVTRPELSAGSRYYIPKHRYYELKHFCLQYGEWQKRYAEMGKPGPGAARLAERVDGGIFADPTATEAEQRIYYRERMEMVERVAREAAGDLGALLLRAVTEGRSYGHVAPPCCKEVWYAAYRRFFWLLDRARK